MAFRESLVCLMSRDLAALRREVEAYEDERLLWAAVPGLPNSGGVLVRHICGNLQHFIGAVLGGTSYVRNRDHEFTGLPESRAALLECIDSALAVVRSTVPTVSDAQLAADFPTPVGETVLETQRFMMHLAVHLGFHCGQLDYHRRAVTGQSLSIIPMGVQALAG